MDETKQASELLEKEIKERLVVEIDKLHRPNEIINGKTPNSSETTGTDETNIGKTDPNKDPGMTTPKDAEIDKNKHNFVVDVDALRQCTLDRDPMELKILIIKFMA